MNLFELQGHRVVFAPQALGLKPFRDLYDRDKSKNKEIAIAELEYMWFMCDYKSDYSDIIDDEERSEEIISVLDLPKKWEKDDVIQVAMDFYIDRSDSMLMKLYKASKILLSKIVKFAETVDLDERDGNDKPIYNVKQINDMVKQLGGTVESVQHLEKMVKAEVSANKTNVGSREKNMFEDMQFDI